LVVYFLSTNSSKCEVGCHFSLLTLGPLRTDPSHKLAIMASCLSILSKFSPNLTFILSICCYIAHNINNGFSLSFIIDDPSLEEIVENRDFTLVVKQKCIFACLHLIWCHSTRVSLNSIFSWNCAHIFSFYLLFSPLHF
jgi:hypothetical protein